MAILADGMTMALLIGGLGKESMRGYGLVQWPAPSTMPRLIG
jgi:hypothetical protein